MLRHINIKISGTVQGVFYRASTHDKATTLGVTGFVRNDRDGSVYVEAEGNVEQLESLVTWCRQGPPRAEVEQVEVSVGELQGFTKFEIRR